jgi:hypothetical protein
MPSLGIAIDYIFRLKWKVVVSDDIIEIHMPLHRCNSFRFSDILIVNEHEKFLDHKLLRGRCYSIFLGESIQLAKKVLTINELMLARLSQI